MEEFESAGMKFVGRDTQNERMEIMELSGHPFYVAVQYHPEYISRPMKPSAPYLGLILAATDKLQSFLSMVCNHRWQYPCTTGDGALLIFSKYNACCLNRPLN